MSEPSLTDDMAQYHPHSPEIYCGFQEQISANFRFNFSEDLHDTKTQQSNFRQIGSL